MSLAWKEEMVFGKQIIAFNSVYETNTIMEQSAIFPLLVGLIMSQDSGV